jgi:hypothetical protein
MEAIGIVMLLLIVGGVVMSALWPHERSARLRGNRNDNSNGVDTSGIIPGSGGEGSHYGHHGDHGGGHDSGGAGSVDSGGHGGH